eukprot:GFUD01040519.1.p1 GENE.GFUD01040519.1~~GFUD01040519.1.p1  ORF type:complete len:297 (+),score=68.72 GFUD01040519.1:912-1802(+)
MQSEETFSIGHYAKNYEMQISEVEILQSMFPGSGELDIDPILIHEVVDWVNDDDMNKHEKMPPPIEFCVKISCGKNVVEVVITLPPEYPKILPEIYVRANELSRANQTLINEDIGEYLENETIPEEPSVVAVISWLQEHSENYFIKQNLNPLPIQRSPELSSGKFSRHWIYSHHIYSKNKRKNLIDLALELGVSGFCMSGKPGIICVEGRLEHVVEWWGVVRNWNWKKITVKIQEELEVGSEEEVEDKRLFTSFNEIGQVKECHRGNHRDMGEFYKYLEVYNSTWVFKELFGIDKS